jgi:hypothetical protein
MSERKSTTKNLSQQMDELMAELQVNIFVKSLMN